MPFPPLEAEGSFAVCPWDLYDGKSVVNISIPRDIILFLCHDAETGGFRNVIRRKIHCSVFHLLKKHMKKSARSAMVFKIPNTHYSVINNDVSYEY